MNQWDSLAGWLFQRQFTPWQRVKQACQTFSQRATVGHDWSPLGHATYWLRPLLELGIVEFDNNNILACPPGIIWTNRKRRGLLCGYWTRERISKLRNSVPVYSKQTDHGPTCYSVVNARHELERAAGDCSAWFSDDRGEQVLSRIPRVSDWLVSLPEDTSSATGHWEKLSFRNRKPIWVSPKEVFVQPGLYRRRSGSPIRVHVLDNFRRIVANPDQCAIAMWFESPPNPWIFLTKKNCLLIPIPSPRLPLLVARSLAIGAGHVANRVRYDKEYWWRYSCVTSRKAYLAAAILEQDLIVR
jgi:hypothetical protein